MVRCLFGRVTLLLGISLLVEGCSSGSGSGGSAGGSTTVAQWAEWSGDSALSVKNYVHGWLKKAMDDQTVSLAHSSPTRNGDKYTLSIRISIHGTKSGDFEKVYDGIECDRNGVVTEEGTTFLKERIQKHKKEMQDLHF